MTSCTRVSQQIAYKHIVLSPTVITSNLNSSQPLQCTANSPCTHKYTKQLASVQSYREKWRRQIARKGKPPLLSRIVGVFLDGSQDGCTPMPSFVRGMRVLLCSALTLYPGVHIRGYGISVSIDFFFFFFCSNLKISQFIHNLICVSLFI